MQAISETKLEEKRKFIARENRMIKECKADVSRVVSSRCITSDHTAYTEEVGLIKARLSSCNKTMKLKRRLKRRKRRCEDS